jgi:hypothetical protein
VARKVVQQTTLFSGDANILGLPTSYISSISSVGLLSMGNISYRVSSLFSTGLGFIEAYIQTILGPEKGSVQSASETRETI